jgi:MFS family permease
LGHVAVSGSHQPDPPGRWRALAGLAVAVLLAMTTWFSATAVVPQLREVWGLGPGAAAWLTIGVQLGFVAGALVSAATNLADVVAPRRLIAASALGAAAANLGLLAVGGAAGAIALRVATGALLAGVYPPAMKAMATWFRRGRGTALGVMVGALTLGSAVPHLVNGLGGVRWQVVILATSAMTVLGGLLALAGADGPLAFPRAVFDPRQAGLVVRDRGVRLATLGYFGHMWELYAMWAWFAPFAAAALAARGHPDPLRTAAFATFAVIGVGAAGCALGGVLGDRWGRTRATALAMAVSGGCAASIGWLGGAAPFALVLALGLVWGVSVVADSAQFSTMVTEVADQRYVGTAVTLQLAIGFTLTVPAIWLVPLVRDAAGWGVAFSMLAPGPLLGILAMRRLRAAPQAAAIAGGRG